MGRDPGALTTDTRIQSMTNTVNAVSSISQRGDSWFRRVINSVEDFAIYIIDTSGRIQTWNSGAERMKGYTKEEIVGQNMGVLYPEEDQIAGLPIRVLAQAEQEGRYEDEGWRVRKDGSRFWASMVITSLRSADGALEGYLKITRDMSELKRHEERFRRVVEAAPNAMIMTNSKGIIEMVNAQATRVFGYEEFELIGERVEMLVPERLRRGHPEKRNSFTFSAPQQRPMGAGRDLFARRKDGSEIPVEIGLNPIETKDGIMVLASIVDISERRQKEERIEAALVEKDILLQEVHHRVKNNLHIVHNLLDLHSGRISDPIVREVLVDCQNRIRSMALIHQTLYQSRDFAKVEFRGFLDSLLTTLVTTYRDRMHKVEPKIDVEHVALPINVAVPCGLLINELITNALKHAFPDGRNGEITVRLEQRVDSRMQLCVRDNGVGIPESLDLSKTDTLGYSLITLLTQQLGGNLTIRRHSPTEFIVDFPVDPARSVDAP